MPNLSDVVNALEERFHPERIRITILSPDRHGNMLAEAPELMQQLHEVESCEVFCIDARSRNRNGLFLADTFDFHLRFAKFEGCLDKAHVRSL